MTKARQANSGANAHSEPFYPSPWMSPEVFGWEEAYAKAKDFVSQMTLLEKVNLTTGVGWTNERCVGNVGDIPRLGLRGLCMQDGPVGVRLTDYNSVFPSGQTTAATWDRDLIYRKAQAIGYEFREKGVDVVLTPVAGPLGRNPSGGRNWEGFSPDPWLTGIAMSESVRGLQDMGVIATAKHFIGNEQEHFRIAEEAARVGAGNVSESLSSNIDDKTMHELYMWPFADAVRAGVGSVMCSYQQVNNSYGCQNSKLINGLLKHELGFQGFVMSDWGAQHSGAATAVAGLDMTMSGDYIVAGDRSYWGANLTVAVLNGTVPAYRVDDMAMRIMAAYFKVGRTVEGQPEINFSSWTDDNEGPIHWTAKENWGIINQHVNVQSDHGRLIREIGAAGTVLLKNEGSLPLQKPRFVAVFGEDAGSNLNGPNSCTDRACADGVFAAGWGSGTSNYPYLITPDQALQQRAIKDGSRYESILTNYGGDNALKLASTDNATSIVFVHAAAGETYITVDGNLGDRNNFTLWRNGTDLVYNVSSVCSNTIVVIHSPGAVDVTSFYENPNITAILWAGLPGQEVGNAITDVLYGDVNPSAKLPFTWGPSLESYGMDVLFEPNNGKEAPWQDFDEGVFIDYRHFDRAAPEDGEGAPIWEFGFGLSYTTFNYSDIRVKSWPVEPYVASTGSSRPARMFGNYSRNPEDYIFPAGIQYSYPHIYPYLNTSDLRAAADDDNYGQTAAEFLPPNALSTSAQPVHPAGGAPGGNPQLWDVLYTVTATVTNTGESRGAAVPQLYVSLGGPNEPARVLRGFERIILEPGASATFCATLNRRDLSNWDITRQNWVITEHEKTVHVGSSSRDLPLRAVLA
ncbi:related to beta-glucosidase [Fusarium oxysporum]|uniref:beta-glucosidase n=1 Tax=Fusarium oxysporum TaxID=5507 RepID=A0A2H3TQW6_FUSOX|nr:related to beta-glucosidase [Fusarium oxysporum]